MHGFLDKALLKKIENLGILKKTMKNLLCFCIER